MEFRKNQKLKLECINCKKEIEILFKKDAEIVGDFLAECKECSSLQVDRNIEEERAEFVMRELDSSCISCNGPLNLGRYEYSEFEYEISLPYARCQNEKCDDGMIDSSLFGMSYEMLALAIVRDGNVHKEKMNFVRKAMGCTKDDPDFASLRSGKEFMVDENTLKRIENRIKMSLETNFRWIDIKRKVK